MSRRDPHGLAPPDPRRISTRREFGRQLTRARQRSGQTVRQVATRVGLPVSTLGGYFAGAHLPALQPADSLVTLLTVLGIVDPLDIRQWREAYWRIRDGSTDAAETDDSDSPARLLVSTRAPVDRLEVEPRVRGRDELVEHLDHSVAGAPQAETSPRVHVLQGLGGCGKSMAALTVADHALATGVATFWIAGADSATLAAGMHALTVQLGAAGYLSEGGSPPDILWRCLGELPHRWLLVLDNVDDPHEVLALPGGRIGDGTGWLRPVDGDHGTVIVTTRDGDQAMWGTPLPPWLRFHRLSGLTDAEGARVLDELTGMDDPTNAAELSERLGGLPLALMLAGRYLAESQSIPSKLGATALPQTYREYRGVLQQSGYRVLMPDHDRVDERMVIGSSWRLSLDLLARRGVRRADSLLGTLACFGTEPLPYSELLVDEYLSGTELFDGITARGIWQALRALDDLGLITLNEVADTGDRAPESLELHPLVRDMARQDVMSGSMAAVYLATSTTLLRAALRNAHPKSPATWRKWRSLLAHCTAPLDLLTVVPSASAAVRAALALGGDAAQFLRASGLREQSASTFGLVQRLAADRLIDTDPLRLDIDHNFARLRYDQGRYREAEELYRSVLARRQASLGPRDPDTLNTQHYLARTLRRLGEFEQARRLLHQTYQLRLQILGERDPDTLTSRQGIADLLRAEGDGIRAETMYAEVLSARTDVLGPEHPSTLSTRQYHAELLHAHGRPAEAEAELRRLWPANQRVRGLDHPRTLAVGAALIDVLRDTGRSADATEVAVAVVGAARRLFGATHPTTIEACHRLALVEAEVAALEDSTAPPASHHSEAT
ncbi:helix-turn-helix transcriptional regulator [Nocardia sp. NPDC050712]|uniref:helix-turn-helix transcriptional regulator n=1 Tax=Nocardia sp. NPDC050712 TaxID=3155518 RepID=UPI0033DC35EA